MRQFFRGAALVIGVVLVAALAFGIGLLWGASGSDDDVVEATGASEVDTKPDAAVDDDADEPQEPEAKAASQQETVPVDASSVEPVEPVERVEQSIIDSRFFEADVPAGWKHVGQNDQELSYGWRTRYQGPDGSEIRVEVSNTQPPATAVESADSIAAAIGDRLVSDPEQVRLEGFDGEVYRIEFRGQSGDSRSDYFFAEGDRGYAVLAIAAGDLDVADAAAQSLISTLRTTG